MMSLLTMASSEGCRHYESGGKLQFHQNTAPESLAQLNANHNKSELISDTVAVLLRMA